MFILAELPPERRTCALAHTVLSGWAYQWSSSTREKPPVHSGTLTAPNLQWGGGEETNPWWKKKEEYFLRFTSQPKCSSRQVVLISVRSLELTPRINFKAILGGRSPARRNRVSPEQICMFCFNGIFLPILNRAHPNQFYICLSAL